MDQRPGQRSRGPLLSQQQGAQGRSERQATADQALTEPVAAALPLSYLGTALRDVALKGNGIIEIALPLGAVVLYGLVGFAIAIKLFRWE